MKLKFAPIFASILTFLLGVILAGLVNSSNTSLTVPRQDASLPLTASSPSGTEPKGYGFATGDSFPYVEEKRPTVEQFRKLVTCKDKTIQLVWKQLTATTEFWDRVNPSYKNHDCSGMFEATKLDLNRDGLIEIKIRGQYGNHCGATGNCGEWVFGYDKRTSKYRLILDSVGVSLHIRKRTTNGYKNIYITTHDSASSSYNMVYKFSRGRYKESKCWFEEYSIDGSHYSISCAEKNRQIEKESKSQ